jgi:uncharacterized protein
MKHLTLTAVFVVAFLISKSQNKNYIDQPHMEVTGYADTMVIPNEIFIKIIVSEKDTRDRVTVEQQEEKMIAAFRTLNINIDSQLSINDMISNYRHYVLKTRDIIKTKQYMLKVTDAATAGKVFMKLEDLGISNTSIDRVDHSSMEVLRNLMRVKATENARTKATAITRTLNQSLGNAIHVIDLEAVGQPSLQGRAAGITIRGYNQVNLEGKGDDVPVITFEKIKVASTVSIKFIIK